MNREGVILFSTSFPCIFVFEVAKSSGVENEVDMSSVVPLYPR